LLIGNDVVDLEHAGDRGTAGVSRFIARVFADEEAAWVTEPGGDPHRRLWALWAAKEAAFKIAQKLDPSTRFVPRRFVVTLRGPTGCVCLPSPPGADHSVLVHWTTTSSYLHAVAFLDGGRGGSVSARVCTLTRFGELELSRLPLTSREASTVRSRESTVVRLLAKELAGESGAGDVEIVRRVTPAGTSPPRLYRFGDRLPLGGWDVSLSHDGRFAAAALLRSETAGSKRSA
jgi:phosphopantetheinyl transferase (holo-ACP synthase)